MQSEYFGSEAAAFNRGEAIGLFTMAPEQYGSQRVELLHNPATEITDAAVRAQLHTARWYPIERNGRRYEVMIFNPECAEDGVDAFFSTYSSSIQDNPGNAYEAAATAARYPERSLVYVASPGNGSTTALSRHEQRAYRKSGMMAEDTVPMEFVQNLAAALAERNLNVRSVIGHSAGTAVALAFGRALPKGQLENMVLYAAPQVTAVSPASLAIRALGWENFWRGRQSRQHAIDPTAVNAQRARFVTEEHPEIYREPRTLKQRLGKLAMLATNMFALAHGPEVLSNSLQALFVRQPDVAVTIIAPEQDGLHTHDLMFNMRGVVDAVADKTPQAKLRAVFIPAGEHAFNTYNPAFVDELTHVSLAHWDYQRTAKAAA